MDTQNQASSVRNTRQYDRMVDKKVLDHDNPGFKCSYRTR